MTAFEERIRTRLIQYYIGKGFSEYERAKRLIIEYYFTKDEAKEAIIIIAKWCGI